MTHLRVWFWRLTGVLFGRRRESTLDGEIQMHLDLLAAEYRRTGMSERQARLAALREFGGIQQVKEVYRDQRGLPFLESFIQDLRFAARTFRRTPLVTIVCLLTLAIGIGANATVFTLVNAELIRGLPFGHPEQIVSVWTETDRGDRLGVSYQDFEDLRDQARAFSHLVATLTPGVNLADDRGAPDRARATYVSWNLFQMLGEHPILGRDFREEDDRPGAEPVVLLSYVIWQNRYGGGDVLGRTVRVNSKPMTVIGVMPRGLEFPDKIAIWIPRAMLPPESFPGRGRRNFATIGRLIPGVSVEQARAEIQSIGDRLAHDYPGTNRNMRLNLIAYADTLRTSSTRLIFLTLMGAVGFVLLIACANVANLLMARAAGRAREIAIRMAQGAGRRRIVRQLLVESVLLSALGGLAGLALSVGGVQWFDRVTTSARPYWMRFTFDPIVFVVVAAICLTTGVLFGIVPAWHVSKTNVNEVLNEGGRSGGGGVRNRRWAGTLVVVELVLTMVLLSSAGFMVTSFVNLYRTDLGFDATNLSVMQLYLPLTKYPRPAQTADLQQRFQDRLKAVAIIRSSTLASAPPGVGSIRSTTGDGVDSRGVAIDGRMPAAGDEPAVATVVEVGDAYFETTGIPILSGRAFGGGDGLPGHGAAIINRRFAELHFRGQDPVGRTVRLSGSEDWLTVIGIAPSVRQRSLATPEPDPVVYVPLRLAPRPGVVALLVRAPASAAAVATLARDELRALDPDIPIYEVQTMDQVLADRRWQSLLFGMTFAIFAGIALVLAAVGLYAVTAYSVVERTREIGVRMALGERPAQIVWLVLRRGLTQLAIGLPIGIAGAFAAGELLESLLVRTSPRDPTTLLSIALLMTAVVALACASPARRAAQMNPLTALRHE